MPLSFVASVALCALTSLRIDAPLTLTAQAPASSQETLLVPWAGVRVGGVDNDDDGAFVGGDGQLSIALDGQGTNEVSVLRIPVLLEGRGLIGRRWRPGSPAQGPLGPGLAGFGGYGYGGAGIGGGVASFQVFDDARLRGFGTWTVRGGGGVELAFGPATTRIELGLGLRDLRFELHGSFAVGAVF